MGTLKDGTYNGWTNYSTWRVNLEIFDGMDIEDMGWTDLDKYDLSLVLKDYVEEQMGAAVKGDNVGMYLVFSYAMAFLQDVNWREIAEMLLSEYENEASAA